ncbi:hypothetical protein [Cellvibrio japonicus]|uniref:Uncharacterized protein n=1 Tax=Cellvibrio japonicus (strain Ueda107) TaxID=498211 RepID=B3PJ16_CELJU|nr:hypothetical protein [Cellvibrio japonicus]ACE83602.1 hypothetical protein CJA_0526 [Cellvibrio japonicus Ueda107]QEI11217.1 hypothetical protein FY117_02525 [Cellvibrio japonicus]QEI14791.1 hypothetical protein FY116_02525 [Cellvibrio japonicus]QEI18371.1 hypothetical protein FY115_02525 [Cellvibrio japonicus]
MSTFRNAINNLDDKSAYIMVGNMLVLATALNVIDDMVEVTLSAPISNGINKIFIHINNLVLASNS